MSKKLLQQKISLVKAQIIAESHLSGRHEDLVNKLNRLKQQLKSLG